MGISLLISKSIIETHHRRISTESDRSGTTFSFTLLMAAKGEE
jgi:signal transduction histidine kinase